jgi:nucleoside-triphosphatase THEP1
MSTCRSLEDILEEVRNRGFDETDVDAIDEIGKLLENVEIEKMPIETYSIYISFIKTSISYLF